MPSDIPASAHSPSPKKRVCTPVPDAYKCPPLHNPRTHDVFQSIVKGRKSWKTLKGGEVVWPPELEAALLEGLEAYQPDDSRETRLLGRFPMRNRFISDYIFHKTGKRRTAKQVGSRLQQLRDTCGGKRLLYLLSPRRPGFSASNDALDSRDSFQYNTDSSSDSSSIPSTPTESTTDFTNARTVICIDLLPDDASYSDAFPDQLFDDLQNPACGDVIHASQHPRPLRSINPTITFISDTPISALSTFTVISSGMTVFSETTALTAVGAAPDGADGALLYSTTLVPGFWHKITKSSDPTQYTIVQEVVKEGPSSPVSMFSAVYKFAYRSKEPEWADSPALSSTPSDQSVDDTRTPGTTHPSISFDALLPMDPTSFVECEDFDTYFDFNDIDMKSNWGFPPSQYPDDISSGYEVLQLCGSQRDMFDRISGSPVEACFHTEPYNYAL